MFDSGGADEHWSVLSPKRLGQDNTLESMTQLLEPPQQVRSCRLEVYRSFEDAAILRDRWDELAAKVHADLFATFHWCSTWWKHFSQGRSLRIFAFWAQENLVALFPMFRETLRLGPLWLRVVRMVGTDHAGTRCWPMFEQEWLQESITSLLDELDREGAWDLLHIGDLPSYFDQADALALALRRSHKGTAFYNKGHYPHAIFPMANSFETYLRGLSGNERNNIRKCERRLSQTHLLNSQLADGAQRETFLADFFQWHDAYWDSQNDLGFFDLWPGAREFHLDFARSQEQNPQAVFAHVRANDESIGAVFAYRFRDRLHLFQAVRAPGTRWESYGPGRLLHCEVFRWCMAHGVTQVDGMSGFYEYKRRLGAHFHGLSTMTLVSPSLGARLRARGCQWMAALAGFSYFRIWLSRVIPKLRVRKEVRNHWLVKRGMFRRFIRSRFLIASLRNSYKFEEHVSCEGRCHE